MSQIRQGVPIISGTSRRWGPYIYKGVPIYMGMGVPYISMGMGSPILIVLGTQGPQNFMTTALLREDQQTVRRTTRVLRCSERVTALLREGTSGLRD